METTVFTKSPLKRKNAKLRERLEKNRKRTREAEARAGDMKKEVTRLRRRVADLEEGMINEVCEWCFLDVEMMWDTKTQGYMAYCPRCGSRLMLCSECIKDNGEGECDYNYGTDNCKYSKGGERD